MSLSNVTAVFSPTGDSLRSFIACHLACGHNQNGLVIDLGTPFSSLPTLLDTTPTKTWADLIPVAHELSTDLLARAITVSKANVRFLAAPEPQHASQLTPGTLHAILQRAKEQYVQVVLDVGPSVAEPHLSALKLADHVAMLVAGDIPGVQQAQQAIGWLKSQGLPDPQIFLAETALPRPLSHQEIARALGPIAAIFPWEPIVLSEARNLGTPFNLRRSALAKAVAELAMDWPSSAMPSAESPTEPESSRPLSVLKGFWGRAARARPFIPQPSK